MSASVAEAHPGTKEVLGVSNGKFAMWIFLGSDGMSFMGLIAAYIALRAGNSASWPNPTEILDINLTAVNTFILICSSVSMVKAYAAAQDGNVKGIKTWLWVTICGGIFFLGVQAYEYNHLIHMGVTVAGLPEAFADKSTLFSSTFYSLTCFHGFHVLSGVIYLLVIQVLVHMGSWTVNRLEIVGLYWHFVDLLWIIIFTIVYLVE